MKHTFILFILLIATIFSFGQISISQTGTVAQWVQNVLVGPGITVSNVTYIGDPLAIGTFTTGATATNLGFAEGIIMTSGKATNAPGPNSIGSITYNSTGLSDPQLAASINTQLSNIKDAAVLEFDFTPVSDTVKFRYVFGSDEYPEFVNSSFNDVFGFFVSGMNPNGGNYVNQNIALIPGTTTPVSINNVNNGTSNGGPCTNCAYYTNNLGGAYIEYDGLTVVLTAWLKVLPCFPYHIKIAIADVGDEAYDSGVFLEANSFMSSTVILDKSFSSTVDTNSIEGCNDAIISFELPAPRPINTIVNYLATGTAVNGVDYVTIPSSITIPAGQDSVALIISPFIDGLTEGPEPVILIVNTNVCTYDSMIVVIRDYDPMVATLPLDTALCDSANLPLQVTVNGGITPYSYLWSSGDTTNSIIVTPTTSGAYTVTVTDQCLLDTTAQTVVNISQPVFQIFGDMVCEGDPAMLSINSNMPLLYQWSTGDSTSSIVVNPMVSTTYTVRVEDTIGCFVDTNTVAYVYPNPIASVSPDVEICAGETATLTASGGVDFQWSNGGTTSQIQVTPQQTTTYVVTVSDLNNCFDTDTGLVILLPTPIAEIISSDDTVCKGSPATLTASQGDVYLWSTGETTPSILAYPRENGRYSVSVGLLGSQSVCSDTAYFTLFVERCNKFFVPSAFTPNGDGLNDKFGVNGVFSNVENFSFLIYDRWGNLVFSTTNPNEWWDGNLGGNALIAGVYTFKVTIKEIFEEEYYLTGSIHLIR
ncbi:MAG: gliding motility-associated C-terminal domain-containing protein [Bacteroidales bacterium]|nr:gliding motility-associated C-terminal domain-containing protein [Bacteroidales bacterium]